MYLRFFSLTDGGGLHASLGASRWTNNALQESCMVRFDSHRLHRLHRLHRTVGYIGYIGYMVRFDSHRRSVTNVAARRSVTHRRSVTRVAASASRAAAAAAAQ